MTQMNSETGYRGFRDLKVFRLSYRLALEIFETTKNFPKEEKYSLVDQIRRSSRSVPANIAEAWYKRRYPRSFISKLVDCSGEAGETEVWIEFAADHGYLVQERKLEFLEKYGEVNKMLNSMINQPETFCH
jgi:four helix bundle protein